MGIDHNNAVLLVSVHRTQKKKRAEPVTSVKLAHCVHGIFLAYLPENQKAAVRFRLRDSQYGYSLDGETAYVYLY